MNMRTTIGAACVIAAACTFAQGTVRLVPQNAASGGAAMAENGDTVKVMGRGVGTTKAEALKDAYRDAIESAVGLYVDAEQMMKNSALVKDQILTQSNAYIEKFDIADESTSANGLVTVRILAVVKKSALTKKLTDVMPPRSFKLGSDAQNVHAVAVTKAVRSEDAAALLKKTLDGVNPITQLVRLSLADPKMLTQELKDGKTCYFYRFKFELDEQKYYNEFLPPLLKVLDQISVSKPKTVRLQRHSFNTPNSGEGSMYRSGQECAKNYIATGEYINDSQAQSRSRGMRVKKPSSLSLDGLYDGMGHYGQEGAYDGVVVLGNANDYWHLSYGSGSLDFGQNCRFEPGSGSYPDFKRGSGHIKTMLDSEAFPVIVITEMNSSRTSVKARSYELPKGCAEIIMDWQYGLIGMTRPNRTPQTTTYQFILKDANNEDVLVRSVAFKNVALINAMAGQGKMFKGEAFHGGYGWYVTPMIHTDAKSLQRWIGFDIPRDVLPNIASISIELAE